MDIPFNRKKISILIKKNSTKNNKERERKHAVSIAAAVVVVVVHRVECVRICDGPGYDAHRVRAVERAEIPDTILANSVHGVDHGNVCYLYNE